MLNPNAEPYQMIHIMSPSAYYYHKATLSPPALQLIHPFNPKPIFPFPPLLLLFHPFNPKPILPLPPQLFNPLYQQKPSIYYPPLPSSLPPPPPSLHHHHQQQPPFPVSVKTKEYYCLMEKISDHKKKGRRIMTKKPKNTKSKVTRKPKPSLSTNSSKRTRRPSSSIPFDSGTRFVPRQHHHQVKMIEDNHGSSYNKYSSKHEVVNDTSSGTGVYLCQPIPKGTANKKTRTKTSPNISTSIMMRNIPNGLSRRMLITIVDQHCIDENRKALRMLYQDDHQDDISSHSESTTLSEYDFLYLPIDFKRKGNYGYAFLNFTTPVAAMRFYNAFNNFSWKDSIYESSKVCKICPARIQGKDELVKRFKNSYFDCDTDEFLPVSFSPPRDGSTPDSFPSLVGKRPKIPRKRV